MTAYDKTMKEMLERIEELEQLSARVGHGWAKEFADRAHGPLEGKAAAERHGPYSAEAYVDALVKAALRIRAEYAESLPVSVGAAAEMELALGPFKPFKEPT